MRGSAVSNDEVGVITEVVDFDAVEVEVDLGLLGAANNFDVDDD